MRFLTLAALGAPTGILMAIAVGIHALQVIAGVLHLRGCRQGPATAQWDLLHVRTLKSLPTSAVASGVGLLYSYVPAPSAAIEEEDINQQLARYGTVFALS